MVFQEKYTSSLDYLGLGYWLREKQNDRILIKSDDENLPSGTKQQALSIPTSILHL